MKKGTGPFFTKFKNLNNMKSKITGIIRILIIAIILGLILGLAGGAFYLCIRGATGLRRAYPAFLLLLPVGALLITLFYRYLEKESDGGTNRVLEATYSDTPVSIRMAPAIFVSTVFSHLCGASVGREGAALQLGGSVGYNIGRAFRLSDEEKRMCVVLGMSACFSALFGTPMAAAVFALEIAIVGRLSLRWLLPSILASYVARFTARAIGAPDMKMKLARSASFTGLNIFAMIVIAAACGIVAWLFVTLLHRCKPGIRNPHVNAVVLGAIVLGLSFIFRGQTYNGAGVELIPQFMEGQAAPWQFAVKMLFTLLSVWAGYRGGEIVPSFYIGAALGTALGNLVGLDPALSCAIGMVSLFCGVTNCPIAAFIIGIEIFGAGAAPFFLVASALAFACSGRASLYTSQKR